MSDASERLAQTSASIAELHAEAMMDASPAQLHIEAFIRGVARPWFAVAAFGFVAAWVAVNVVLVRSGGHGFDAPQFPYLQLLLSLASLFATVLILIYQSRMSEVEQRRAHVTLQIALLAEQKTAKLVAMLEELRRDDPHLPNRRDPEAERMAEAVDLRRTMQAMDEAQERALRARGENDKAGD